ncbi:alginate O-acetyltransferase AlgX-related protein [Ancylobacter amanitiformis]|uniref:AlgX/AlgJ SGNH hydrolase-like domain-containing protein n=1 Tax=Ancylobacter amanitiformis TaxID=217069 RepID=A0ABU0LRK7_9HYPH|nr:hypothetical protein [Ancylobacter amanitiformis]MDQ0511339.1 hypothetical protein [Ancylobacter amanitiformis]
MSLLLAFRRWWAILFVAVLCLPAIGHFLPDLPAPMRTVVAPEARWWEEANKRMDPYLNNTFGFRGAVLAAHGAYVRFIGAPRGPSVLRGTDGSLFYTGDHALEQSVGQLLRPAQVSQFVDWVRSLKREIEPWGGRLVVVIAPNAQTIQFDHLPDYARRQMKRPTEYDLLDQDLAKAGIPHADLRPRLLAAKADAPVYWRFDTHWNQRGALIGFNAALAAIGRADLEINPDEALGPPEPRTDGDLVRLTGNGTSEPADVQYPVKPPVAVDAASLTPLPGIAQARSPRFPFPPLAFETGHPGPRIMVIGDSFTYGLWKDYLAYRSSAFVWTHHLFCRGDPAPIARFKPDILIVAAAERLFPCPLKVPEWAESELRR